MGPDQEGIGQVVMIGNNEFPIVGIVADVRHSSLAEEAGLEMYLLVSQGFGWSTLDLVVRSSRPLESLAGDVRATLQAFDPTLPTGDYRALGELVDRAVSPRRFILVLLGVFAQIALLLAALGIYGVVSYSVSQQYPEIGIRMALGATAGRVRLRIVTRTVRLVAVGLGIGLVATLVVSRMVASLLYGVRPTDPLTITAVIVILTLVSVLAGFIPAYRASRIDPMSVIRSA
jgi:ABC-type antimicrobial peptide transport system permease subunit